MSICTERTSKNHRLFKTLIYNDISSLTVSICIERTTTPTGWAGHGYELTGIDVLEALRYATEAAQRLGQGDEMRQRLRQSLTSDHPAARWMRQVVGIA